MNVSGQAVQRTQAFYKIEPKQTIVVHDEIDLPFGKLRVKVGGGHGGHNGLRSIIAEDGRRASFGCAAEWASPTEAKKGLPATYSVAFQQVGARQNCRSWSVERQTRCELVLEKGTTAAMNKVNTDTVAPRSGHDVPGQTQEGETKHGSIDARRAGHAAGVRDDLHPAPGHQPGRHPAGQHARQGRDRAARRPRPQARQLGQAQARLRSQEAAQGHLPVLAVSRLDGRGRGDRAQPAHARPGHPLLHGQGRRERRSDGQAGRDRRRDVQQGRDARFPTRKSWPRARRSCRASTKTTSRISTTTSCRRSTTTSRSRGRNKP